MPLSWADEIVNAKTGKISVALATYKGSKKIGTKAYSLKLVIPATDEFLPEFDLVVERLDNSVPEEIGEYVKGKSQVRLNVEGLVLQHGAKVASYTAKVDSFSKASLPAVFDLVKSGELTVSVTVKDSRGFSVTKSFTTHPKTEEFLLHNHTGYEILFVFKGNVLQLVEGNTYNVSKNDMIIVRNDEFHQLFPKDEEYERIVIGIDKSFFEENGIEK